MFQTHRDGIKLQAGNGKFGNHCICRLHGRVGLGSERTPEMLQSAMNQEAEKLPQPFGKAQLRPTRTATADS